MELEVTVINGKHFTITRETKLLVAERSDLGPGRLQRPLYDDATDVGFALYNQQLNSTTRWHWSQDVRNEEGELIASIYKPTHETMRRYPASVGWEIHILND